MKRLVFISAIAVCLCCMTGCTGRVESQEENQDSIELSENDNDIPEELKLSNRFSPEEIESMKRNGKILYQHLKIADDSLSYIFDMTEEEATKLGVDKLYYDNMVESIDSVNASIKRGCEKGEEVGKLMTPEEFIKALENAK